MKKKAQVTYAKFNFIYLSNVCKITYVFVNNIAKNKTGDYEESWVRLSSQTATDNDKHDLPRHEIVKEISLLISCNKVNISQEAL